VDYVFVNNSLETYTADASGAIATHVASVRAAAERAGTLVCVLTRALPGHPPLDEGPTIEIGPDLRLPAALVRVARKLARLRGWQSHVEWWHARQVTRVLRRTRPSAGGRCLVLHNDPDVADHLAERFPDDVVVHVWHNVLPYGRARSARVRHLAVSRYLARAVAAAAGAVPDLVPNGVDAERFHPCMVGNPDVTETPGRPLTVSFLGRTGREKGPDLLLEALLALPDPVPVDRVLVIGANSWGVTVPDPYQTSLAELVARLESRGVRVASTGHVGREQVADVLRGSDIHVVPSRWEDPAPLVLMEAMASGLCVIAARSGGMPEYGGAACLWFEREDVAGLSRQLVRVLSDAGERAQMRVRAREQALGLTWDETWAAVRTTTERR
jgi:glycosyltransferase involved in cell wall biosynthesis